MSGEMILASADEKKYMERRILRDYLGGDALFSIILSILPGVVIGHECGNSFAVLFAVIASFLIVGTGIGGICGARGIKNYRQELAALGDTKQIIHKLLAMRSEIEGQVGELENKRYKLDRELAALTSDDFVEEFVWDKPFPLPPALPPASKRPDPENYYTKNDWGSDCG